MKHRKRITGRVSYQNLGMGFWGITGQDGKKWRPIQMPEQLRIEGAQVQCTVQILDDDVSTQMWGQGVRIVSFETPVP